MYAARPHTFHPPPFDAPGWHSTNTVSVTRNYDHRWDHNYYNDEYNNHHHPHVGPHPVDAAVAGVFVGAAVAWACC